MDNNIPELEELINGCLFLGWLITAIDGDASDIKPTSTSMATYKTSAIKSSKNYNPVLDERNYTKRKDICTGYWNTILDSFKAPITRTRFAFLAPKYEIKPHIDYNTTYSIRVHIPIITNPGSIMVIDNVAKHLPADGSVWITNNTKYHNAFNGGEENRIHLVACVLDLSLIHI